MTTNPICTFFTLRGAVCGSHFVVLRFILLFLVGSDCHTDNILFLCVRLDAVYRVVQLVDELYAAVTFVGQCKHWGRGPRTGCW